MTFYGQFLDTLGIEFEGIGLDRNSMADFFMGRYPELINEKQIQFVHDASTEFIAEYMRAGSAGMLKFSTHTKAARKFRQLSSGNRVTMGYEIVTAPMIISQLEGVVYRTINTLQDMGDFVSERAATHYHIGFVNNLAYLQTLLRICLTIDPVLYRLGGMGEIFRGYSNRSAYARPLLHSVCTPFRSMKIPNNIYKIVGKDFGNKLADLGIGIPMNLSDEPEVSKKDTVSGNFVQIINPLAALEATSIEQFWACFGVDYPRGGEVKYHPTRYTGCNFFSIPAHGTMEFRHFNQSMNSFLIVAIAKLLRGIVEMSIKINEKELRQFEVMDSLNEVSMGDAVEILSMIMDVCRDKNISNLPTEREMTLIHDILSISSVSSIPEMPVLTHIPDFYVPNYTAALGDLKAHNKAFAPKQVDIHNIKNQSFFSKGDI